ncbi:histidine kinase [Pontibacter oryzae]|uniref:Histidine kinase n=1 Tax=Pontibacter oryzae TaxID=2304593 RepID=A0A399RW43_9BACT|nr:histidine kinase [Pontibacter oryzae]RIJ34067.1 histidine kinase [Pontibacter oryzae]
MNQAQVDFQQLRIKHILFKSKVRSVLYGGNMDHAFFSTSGPIEVWFSTIGLSYYYNEPGIKTLHRMHLALNAIALQLFNLYSSGRIDQAHEGLRKLEDNSEDFLSTLHSLEDKYKAYS